MPSEPFVGVLLSRNDCLAGFLSADETQAAVTDDIVTDESTLPQNFGPEPEQVARFIEHWAPSGGAERANFPSFAHNLCDVLAVLHPEPTLPDVSENAYVFERDVTFQNQDGSTSIGRIDLYKRSCFVLERGQFKVCALAVQYGMGEESLAQSLGEPPIVARELLRLHRRTYPAFWRWSEAAVNHAMLLGWLQTVFGWCIRVGANANPRSLSNFPCQANGAEMLRLACCLATERGIQVCAPVHDAILIEATVEGIDDAVRETQRAMREASEIILPDFSLRTDADIVCWPDRYRDERGVAMWTTVCEILDEIDAESAIDSTDNPGGGLPTYLGSPPPTTPAAGCYPA